MTSTLLRDPEEVELERIRTTLRCFASHLWVGKDKNGHTWPFIDCNDCDRKDFCRELRVLTENKLNR